MRFFQRDLIFTKQKETIAKPLLKEILNALDFLSYLGLDYLTLDRTGGTLIRRRSPQNTPCNPTRTRLTGVLYVLDEPSVGLHSKRH